MSTASFHTFVDSYVTPRALSQSNAEGDTLHDVIADPVRRNKLIDDNNLLKGVRMTASGPQPSSRELIVRPDTLNAVINTSSTISTTTVEAEFTETLMQSNYNSVSIKASVQYVTANAEYSNEKTYKNTETQKTILVSSRYLFPQGRIDLTPPGTGYKDDVKLSANFTDAIDAALAKSSLNDKREALYSVFNEFGDVFCTKVQIGGTLSAHTIDVFNRSESENEVKQDVKGGLEATVDGWGGGVTAGHGNKESKITTKQGRVLDVKYIVTGGDYTKIMKTDEWIASTNKSEYWRGIEVTEVIPIVDMLPKSIRSNIKTLMTPLLGKWVDVESLPNTDNYPVSIYRPKTTPPAGWHFLGHMADGRKALIVKATLGPKSGRNSAIVIGKRGTGFTDQPLPTVPQYSFLSTYFGGYSPSVSPDSNLVALRPGLFLEGQWEMHGDKVDSSVYVTRAVTAQSPEDECFDLQPVIRVKQAGTDNPPRPRWALKKNVVLFDTSEI